MSMTIDNQNSQTTTNNYQLTTNREEDINNESTGTTIVNGEVVGDGSGVVVRNNVEQGINTSKELIIAGSVLIVVGFLMALTTSILFVKFPRKHDIYYNVEMNIQKTRYFFGLFGGLLLLIVGGVILGN